MGWACGTYGKKMCIRCFDGETRSMEAVFEDLAINRRQQLKHIVWEGVKWMNLAQSREEVAGCCECGNERFDSMKCGRRGILIR